MRVGIVGNGSDKFTELGEQRAKDLIHDILVSRDIVVVSGHSPVGGIDIWAEEAAELEDLPTDIKAPRQHSWHGEYGYRARNLDIAASDVVHVILADVYPETYTGRRFSSCYHHDASNPLGDHVKSGGCWTGKWAIRLGNRVEWHIIKNY